MAGRRFIRQATYRVHSVMESVSDATIDSAKDNHLPELHTFKQLQQKFNIKLSINKYNIFICCVYSLRVFFFFFVAFLG